MEINIQNANYAAGAVDFTIGRIFPPGRIVTSQLVVVTQTGASIVSIDNGNSIAETAIPGVRIDGNVIAEVAKIEGFIAAMAVGATIGVEGAVAVGGAGVLGLTIGLSAIAMAIAITSNKTARDVLTDPGLWENIGNGNLNGYLKDIYGLNLSDLMKALWNGFMSGNIGDALAAAKVVVNNPDPLVKDIKYVMVDPLVLDLDGDGLEITPLSQGVQFDGNGDTIRTNTSWIDADDGLLALDRNGNGVIDSGRELFGDETLLADGKKAAHGFAALAELDVGGAANATGGAGDGVFDAKDAQYTNVRIWRDLNQDGISQAGEMQTLAEAGIASIKLGSTATNTSYGDAQLVQSGSFTRTDGSEGQAGSFILAQNNAVTALNPQLRVCSHRRKRRGCAGCGERQEIWGASSRPRSCPRRPASSIEKAGEGDFEEAVVF